LARIEVFEVKFLLHNPPGDNMVTLSILPEELSRKKIDDRLVELGGGFYVRDMCDR
jgi:hypothetical protein